MSTEEGSNLLACACSLSRRDLFSRVGDGLYGAALALVAGEGIAAADAPPASRRLADLEPRPPHFAPRARSVIQLFMTGGPSQLDLFDPKPLLDRYAGTPPPRSALDDIARLDRVAGGILPPRSRFARHGRSGMEISELLPHTATCADDLAVIRSMFTGHSNHEPAIFLMHTGRLLPGRPTLGAWIVYGLGSENRNLPGYVVLDDPGGLPRSGIENWQSGWLPPVYQGTRMRSEGPPMLNLRPAEEFPAPVLERARALLGRIDAAHRERHPFQPELDARIASYELAARMQLQASDALDLSTETAATQELYGLDAAVTASYGRRCLMARRLVERGVRIVQIYMNYNPWDHHDRIEQGLRETCAMTDRPIAGLLQDLKQRGLFESTLVVWGGEFGRLPHAEIPKTEKQVGRDHNANAFTVWLAGAGIKGGTVWGATDELGYKAVENRVSVHDLHGTILHLLGLRFRDLVYERLGRHERLTDEFPARVVSEILA
jgi:hypothetical protein